MKDDDQPVYDTLHRIYRKHRRKHRENGDSKQMCCMWSTNDPPDVIEGTPPFDDIAEAFGITIDDDAALELYDMDLDKAAIRIQEMQRLQPGDGDTGSGAKKIERAIPTSAAVQLTALFRRNGCMRRHDARRYAAQGHMQYKKGEEIRLVANGSAEQKRILRLLKLAGFRAGRPFRKAPQRAQSCVPVYGREQVARFLRMMEET